jgi:hypothetical protein
MADDTSDATEIDMFVHLSLIIDCMLDSYLSMSSVDDRQFG